MCLPRNIYHCISGAYFLLSLRLQQPSPCLSTIEFKEETLRYMVTDLETTKLAVNWRGGSLSPSSCKGPPVPLRIRGSDVGKDAIPRTVSLGSYSFY